MKETGERVRERGRELLLALLCVRERAVSVIVHGSVHALMHAYCCVLAMCAYCVAWSRAEIRN